MKKSFTFNKKILLILTVIFGTQLYAGDISSLKIAYNKVYRTDRIADSYHFLLLSKDKQYYYLQTNKVSTITASELKSPKVLEILKTKQSWGQAFASKGKFIEKKGKLYTEKYWDKIKIISKNKIRYLNKTYKIQ